MDALREKDNVSTISAIGLLAYASSDIGHHVLGHGAACLASSGRIVLLSSIFVDCTHTGTTIDLAGPLANLLIGLIALLGYRMVRQVSPATQLFLILAGAFNLLWFFMQLVFSAGTLTDDWAWAIHEFHVTGTVRIGLIVIGASLYGSMVRFIAAELAPFSQPPGRTKAITLITWLTAGIFACVTAALDHHPLSALLQHAAPQALANSIGLLFVPGVAAKMTVSSDSKAPLAMSMPFISAAIIVGALSIILLGPGIAIPY